MHSSSSDLRDRLYSQFQDYTGNSGFKVAREDLQETRVDITFLYPKHREVWHVIASRTNHSEWDCQAYSFIGEMELTAEEEGRLEEAYQSVWQGAVTKPHGEQLLEEALDKLYGEFFDAQLALLRRINPPSPNGVTFSPCMNNTSTSNQLRWWIRAHLQSAQPDLEAIFTAGQSSTASIRGKLERLGIKHSLVGFEYAISDGS